MSFCLVCRSPARIIMSFGAMPLANGFLREDAFQHEHYYDLKIAFCEFCNMVQLADHVEPEKMFHENYAFYSSTSQRMQKHFADLAQQVITNLMEVENPFVIELGSNDGILLKNFARANVRHLGIEPSANVARVASEQGIQTLSEFFDESAAQNILQKHGAADVFLGANVMCHIPNINSVISGIRLLLKPDGVLIFEDPYLGDILDQVSYDQIYDEHIFYFSLRSIQHLLRRHKMEVVDVERQNVHGGSMRYTVAHQSVKPISKNVRALEEEELDKDMDKPERYNNFRRAVDTKRQKLRSLLTELKRQGKRVIGYGATSKSTTTLNYSGIDSSMIEFISDTTPSKQGTFSPGVHIPVKSYEDFVTHYPDYALLFAWNHKDEIMSKEMKFNESGGKWIVYVPQVEVIDGGKINAVEALSK